MGKGDIRTRRGKVWRGTYGVTRPRRWKTAVRPATATRKVKTLKDLPNAVAEPLVETISHNSATEATDQNPVLENAEVETTAAVETASDESSEGAMEKKQAAKKPKKPSVKKPAAKKDLLSE